MNLNVVKVGIEVFVGQALVLHCSFVLYAWYLVIALMVHS